MEAALQNAISGLRAAGKRLEVSASNTVNTQSGNYTPGRVEQTALAGGGTKAEAVRVNPPTVPIYDPQHPAADAEGVVQRPNVALESEMVEQMLARRAFEANLRTIETADQMTRSVLDILA
jgi:flagellar basal-body rod protein FlgC